jgi:hypothetical protein
VPPSDWTFFAVCTLDGAVTAARRCSFLACRAFGVAGARVRREPGAVGVGSGGRGGRRRRRGDGPGRPVVVAQRQWGLLPAGPRPPGPRAGRRGAVVVARERRGRGRVRAQEAAPVQGAVRVPGGELQGAQHPQPRKMEHFLFVLISTKARLLLLQDRLFCSY